MSSPRPLLVAFGGNLGDRRAHLARALDRLCADPDLRFLAASSLWETEPVGGPPQPLFLNACALFETDLGAGRILDRLQRVEEEAGRRRPSRNAPRTLDLDLLLLGREVVRRPDLEVPHPRMAERPFVLVPAAEVGPGLVHPPSGLTVGGLRKRLPDTEGVRWSASPDSWSP